MRRQQSKSVVFLTELLLALMIFALCASTCASLFGWAHRISKESSELSQAVVAAQSGAEAFKAISSQDGLAAAVQGTIEGSICLVGYDDDWKVSKLADASYIMQIHFSEEDILRRASISVLHQTGEIIYALEATALYTEGRS